MVSLKYLDLRKLRKLFVIYWLTTNIRIFNVQPKKILDSLIIGHLVSPMMVRTILLFHHFCIDKGNENDRICEHLLARA